MDSFWARQLILDGSCCELYCELYHIISGVPVLGRPVKARGEGRKDAYGGQPMTCGQDGIDEGFVLVIHCEKHSAKGTSGREGFSGARATRRGRLDSGEDMVHRPRSGRGEC